MRDVLGPDRLRDEAPRERGAHGVIAVGRQQRVETIDVPQPDAGAPMGELGQIVQRGGPQREQMLSLQIAFGALAGHGGHVLGAMLRQRRLGVLAQTAAACTASNRPATIRTRSR